ncbi:MAG: alpha/beta hydrolase [Pseudomonadota bacterium]
MRELIGVTPPELNIAIDHFITSDGTRLVWREMGQANHEKARPVILLHGLFSNAEINWIKYGHAATIAAPIAGRGRRVIMPDFRAHGMSDAPHDPACYPPDILARDVEELVAHLGLADFDLGGFSLGARTAVRCVVRGMRPHRLILGGMGLEGLAGMAERGSFFRRAIAAYETAKRGDDVWMAVQFIKTMKVDRVAADLLLQSLVATLPVDLATITMPTLVVCGSEDSDNGSAAALAAALSDARHVAVPGTHMSSVTFAAMGEAMAAFLSA